jgi:hypothetical protein
MPMLAIVPVDDPLVLGSGGSETPSARPRAPTAIAAQASPGTLRDLATIGNERTQGKQSAGALSLVQSSRPLTPRSSA